MIINTGNFSSNLSSNLSSFIRAVPVRRPSAPASPSCGSRTSPTTRRQFRFSLNVHTCPQPDPTRPTTSEARRGKGRIQQLTITTFYFFIIRKKFPNSIGQIQMISKLSSNKRSQTKMCNRQSMRGSAKYKDKSSCLITCIFE